MNTLAYVESTTVIERPEISHKDFQAILFPLIGETQNWAEKPVNENGAVEAPKNPFTGFSLSDVQKDELKAWRTIRSEGIALQSKIQAAAFARAFARARKEGTFRASVKKTRKGLSVRASGTVKLEGSALKRAKVK